MKNCYDNDKIVAYIDNELSRDEREQFKIELKNNSDLLKEYNNIKNLMNSLKTLPKVSTDSDFMVKLNQRIEEDKNLKLSWLDNLISKIFEDRPPITVGLSALSLVVIVAFSIFMLNTESNEDYKQSPIDANYLKSSTALDSNIDESNKNQNEIADEEENKDQDR